MTRNGWLGALALSALLFLPALARADDDDAEYAPAVAAHRAGRWSLQFEIDDNFRLGSFAGTGISVTKNTSPSSAWQFGLSYTGSTLTSTQEAVSQTDTTTITIPGPGQDSDLLGLELDLLRIHRYKPASRVGVFLGAGPDLQFVHQRDHSVQTQSGGPTLSQRNSFDRQFYGVDARFGAEFMVGRSVSVHARYGGVFGYEHSKRENVNVSTNPGDPPVSYTNRQRSRRWALIAQGVQMGISVYL
jgi:hypothetical protein